MTDQRIDLGLSSTPSADGCGSSCGCGHAASSRTTPGASSNTTPDAAGGVTELRVEGMTCDHCVRAVTEELSSIDGVTGVDVDLRPGTASLVRVQTSGPLERTAVAAAIDEAGYTLA